MQAQESQLGEFDQMRVLDGPLKEGRGCSAKGKESDPASVVCGHANTRGG